MLQLLKTLKIFLLLLEILVVTIVYNSDLLLSIVDITLFYAEKCCHLVSEHDASAQCQCSSICPFLMYSTLIIVLWTDDSQYRSVPGVQGTSCDGVCQSVLSHGHLLHVCHDCYGVSAVWSAHITRKHLFTACSVAHDLLGLTN